MRKKYGILVALFYFSTINTSSQSSSYGLPYGTPCEETDQCGDHRYLCAPDENNEKKCFCDRFHKWMGSKDGCVQIYNTSDFIRMMQLKQTDRMVILKEERDKLFQIQVSAALVVLVAILCGVVSVLIYCIYNSKAKCAIQRINRPKICTCPPGLP